jgi:hypothetical protein
MSCTCRKVCFKRTAGLAAVFFEIATKDHHEFLPVFIDSAGAQTDHPGHATRDGGADAGVSLVLPKTYKATASVVLNYKGVDPVTGHDHAEPAAAWLYADPDRHHHQQERRAARDRPAQAGDSPDVVKQFNDSTGGKGSVRDWLAEALLKKLEVVPARDSSVVRDQLQGHRSQLRRRWWRTPLPSSTSAPAIQLKVEPMKKAAAYFDDQTKPAARRAGSGAEPPVQVPAGKGHLQRRQPPGRRIEPPERPVRASWSWRRACRWKRPRASRWRWATARRVA